MIYDSLENSLNDNKLQEVLRIRPRVSRIRIESDEKENENFNLPDKVFMNHSKDSFIRSNLNENKNSCILSERDLNKPSFQLSGLLKNDFQNCDEEIPQDSLENQRNLNTNDENIGLNEVSSPKFQTPQENQQSDKKFDKNLSITSPDFHRERVKKWKTCKSKSISNIYIVDHSTQNDFVSLYSKKSDQSNSDISFKQFRKTDSGQKNEKDAIISQLTEENLEYSERLNMAEKVILDLRSENHDLLQRERDYVYKIEDLTQKLEKIGLFSSRSQSTLKSPSRTQFKEKDVLIQSLKDEIESLKRDNDHLRYIQEKILLNDKLENAGESKKESANMVFRQNTSFDYSSVNLYDTSTIKTYQDTTLPPLKESDLALSHIPREDTRETKEIKKFIECLTNLVLDLSPPGFYQGKPMLKEIWKWLQNFLNQYMQLKKGQNSKDSVEYLLIAKDLLEAQKYDDLHKFLEEMLLNLTR